jgi:hypothetical protein
METRRARKSRSLAAKSIELAVTAPQVIAHRIARLTLAGPVISDRDRREFLLMVNEKHAAFAQAWAGMAMQGFHSGQALMASTLRCTFTPFSYRMPSAASIAAQLQTAAIGMLSRGLAPIHRKAVSNARRLGKTKLR